MDINNWEYPELVIMCGDFKDQYTGPEEATYEEPANDWDNQPDPYEQPVHNEPNYDDFQFSNQDQHNDRGPDHAYTDPSPPAYKSPQQNFSSPET